MKLLKERLSINEKKLQIISKDLLSTKKEVEEKTSELERVYVSTSWRVTKQIRVIKDVFNKFFK